MQNITRLIIAKPSLEKLHFFNVAFQYHLLILATICYTKSIERVAGAKGAS